MVMFGSFRTLFVAINAFIACAVLCIALGEEFLTTDTGHRVGTNQHSQTVTRKGPILLQDVLALEKLRRFNTERIPERVVHARGAGVHGEFTSTMDLSHLTAAKFLSAPGIKTEMFVRFSTVIHSKHSPETLRDPRGFALKFKTATEGVWDMVGNNLPVFFIRDHIKFPDVIHAFKPDPVTNIQDFNRIFDFFAASGGVGTSMLTYLFSDLGIPAAYRFMHGSSVHAYKLVNAAGKVTYVKFRWFTQQGERNLTAAEAEKIQGKDFNHATRDLYDAIERGDYPKWDMAIQIMPMEEMDKQPFNPLDATKIWPEDKFPYMKIGTFVLNRVPDNFFLNTEQVAFSPANILPGSIEPSEDRMLQGRLISYSETQTHRHGSNNYHQLPVNRPISPVHNYQQDGVMVREHAWNGSVNYQPSLNPGEYLEDPDYLYSTMQVCGQYVQKEIGRTLNFAQAGDLYRSFSPTDRTHLVMNLATALRMVKSSLVKNIMCAHFYKADPVYGTRVTSASNANLSQVKLIASQLKE